MEIYKPSEDTLLLADAVREQRFGIALEIGTGSGFVAVEMARRNCFTVASDINLESLLEARERIKRKGLQTFIGLVLCEGALAMKRKAFDLVTFNPPYLPSSSIDDMAVDGGKEGVELTVKFFLDASEVVTDAGTILFLLSSLSSSPILVKKAARLGFRMKKVASKRLFFEELHVFRAKKQP